jgi:two-component system NtrC family sensor kinase
MFETILTIEQNCRRCYTCVRDCPAKAIKIVEEQASVVAERCVACGNCTVVCSQHAKTYVSGLELTRKFLQEGKPVAALLAPSFPAEFPNAAPRQVVSALKDLGFRYVVEVGYGADLVSSAYVEFLKTHPEGPWIASACAALVEYVRKYHPDLTSRLVPIVSPMMATAMVVKEMYEENPLCVFIGPCVAKKLEAWHPSSPPVVDEVLTFKEVRRLFLEKGIVLEKRRLENFDPPEAGMGRAFPLIGGLVKSAALDRDLLDPSIIEVSGHQEVIEVLKDLSQGEIKPILVEALMCEGCHDGPGMTKHEHRLNRKDVVKKYVNEARRQAMATQPQKRGPEKAVPEIPFSSLERNFLPEDRRLQEPTEEEIRAILVRTNKFVPQDELNCKACGYDTCRQKAIASFHGLAEEAMCLPFMIEQAERVCHELKIPWTEIRAVHRHLINTEKLASMGQLAAGVAHELNNPLGTILLYTNLLQRKLKERTDLSHDLNLLVEESNRCKKIVGGLLDFARQNRVRMEGVNLGELLQRIVKVSFDSVKLAEKKIRLVLENESSGPMADVDRDQLTQVIVNLIKNAVEAMDGKGGEIRVKAEELPEPGRVHITVADQGCGIPAEDRERIFQPFFTTKNIGKGVGLGLPICYGIVKMHRGNIWYDSVVGQGTVFHIEVPKIQSMAGRSMLS